jgi:hypothetical protein
MNGETIHELLKQAWLAGFGFAAFEREHGDEMLGTRDDGMRQDIQDILEQALRAENEEDTRLL